MENQVAVQKKNKPFTLKTAVSSFPETYDPITRSEFYTDLVNYNLFETLIKQTESNEYEPLLAKGWVNTNDSTLIISVRDNIYFHNGKHLDIEDIKASIKRGLFSKESIYRHLFNCSRFEITKIKDFQYEIESDLTEQEVMDVLSLLPIYNSNIIKQFNNTELKTNPVGTGKYYIHDKSDSLIVLKRFEDHWSQKPEIEQVMISKIQSTGKQTDLLLHNKLDFILSPPLDRINDIKSNVSTYIKENTGKVVMYMMLDAQRKQTPSIPLKKNPLLKKEVRKALWHSVNIDKFIREKLNNKALKISQPFIPIHKGYNKNIEGLSYDPQKAKELLEKAGYPNGFSLRLDCIKSKYMGDKLIGKYVEESFEDIGIDTEIVYNTSETFYNKIDRQNSSIYITGYTSYANNIYAGIWGLYDSKKGNLNRFRNHYEPIQKFIETRTELKMNPGKHSELLIEATNIVKDTYYVIPLYAPKDLYALNTKYEWRPQKKQLIYFSDFYLKDENN